MWWKMGLKAKGKYRNDNHVKKQINSKKIASKPRNNTILLHQLPLLLLALHPTSAVEVFRWLWRFYLALKMSTWKSAGEVFRWHWRFCLVSKISTSKSSLKKGYTSKWCRPLASEVSGQLLWSFDVYKSSFHIG